MIKARRSFSAPTFTALAAVLVAIGIFVVFHSFAATNSITYSGKLSPKTPSQTKSLAIGASGTLTAQLTYSKLTSVSLQLIDPGGTVVSTATGASPINLSSPVSSGNYQFKVSGNGNGSYTLNATYPVPGDTTNPAVAITQPASGATISGTVTVSGTASDNVSLSKVEVSVDGGAFQPATGTTSWTYSLNTTTLSNGSHTMTARAVDSSSNAATASVTAMVSNTTADTTAPTISISSPAAGATVGGTTTVSGTASDNVALTKVEVQIDGGALMTATGTTSWNYSLNTTTLTNGAHTVTALASDLSGNVGKVSITINVSNNTADTLNPNVTIISPANGDTVKSKATVSGTASDNVALSKVEVQIDGGAWATATGTSNWNWTWDTSSLANGSHILTSRATDTSGNVGTAIASVVVSNSTAALSTCSDGSAVIQQVVTPEGARIAVCTTVGGWTTTSIYNLLQPNAHDLTLIGPHLTIQVQTGSPSSEGSSASCCDAAGHYYGYGAVIVLNPSSTSSFSAAPEAVMTHEYGHSWTYYWHYMNPANSGSWAAYDNFRWAAANGTQVLSQNPNLNTSYSWMDYEMAADDYRRLFGTPTAQSQLTFLNSQVPDSQQVTGLANWFTNTWK